MLAGLLGREVALCSERIGIKLAPEVKERLLARQLKPWLGSAIGRWLFTKGFGGVI